MTLSIFAQQIETLTREKKEFEGKAHQKLSDALASFISETEVKPEEVLFKQNGFQREINEIEASGGVLMFQWVIKISHGDYHLEATAPVYAVEINDGEASIRLGVGDYPGNGGLEDPIFMRKLVDNLRGGIYSAFP